MRKGICDSWLDFDGIGESGASRAGKAEPAEACRVGGVGGTCTHERCVSDVGIDIDVAGRPKGGDRQLRYTR